MATSPSILQDSLRCQSAMVVAGQFVPLVMNWHLDQRGEKMRNVNLNQLKMRILLGHIGGKNVTRLSVFYSKRGVFDHLWKIPGKDIGSILRLEWLGKSQTFQSITTRTIRAIYQPNLLFSHRMLLLRKDSDSWKRVSGLMDHWDQWRQMPQVSCRAQLDYLFVTQWWLCMMINLSASEMPILYIMF